MVPQRSTLTWRTLESVLRECSRIINCRDIVWDLLHCDTYHKPLNLYQNLHFSSHNPRNILKAIIKGECIRYARTNTTHETYAARVFSFTQRLLKRNYPKDFINKVTTTVQYSDRQKFLQSRQVKQPRTSPPLYKVTHLTYIIISNTTDVHLNYKLILIFHVPKVNELPKRQSWIMQLCLWLNLNDFQ